MKITRSQLKNLIKEELKESLSGHQSELSYSHTNPPESKKALQRNYWKAHRGPGERADIESQVAMMDTPETDQRTLGDILPIPHEEWENYSAVSDSDVPSEKLSYLYDLAHDVARGREGSDISYDDIERIGELVYDQFGFDWVRMIVRERGDWQAQAHSEELEHYDHGDDPSNIREAQHKIKITRSQLKQLIKEVMIREADENTKPKQWEIVMQRASELGFGGEAADRVGDYYYYAEKGDKYYDENLYFEFDEATGRPIALEQINDEEEKEEIIGYFEEAFTSDLQEDPEIVATVIAELF